MQAKKKIDLNALEIVRGSRYPAPFHEPCMARERKRLGDAAGLDQFGVNLLRLLPGSWSSQRHYHMAEDEFVYVLEGEIVLVTEAGEEVLRAGDCAGFKAGTPDGHHLQNRSGRDAIVLEVGSRRGSEEEVFYPDIDLHLPRGAVPGAYVNRDGKPYPKRQG